MNLSGGEKQRLALSRGLVAAHEVSLQEALDSVGVFTMPGSADSGCILPACLVCLQSKCDLILMDEPTSSVDSKNEQVRLPHPNASLADLCVALSVFSGDLLRRLPALS